MTWKEMFASIVLAFCVVVVVALFVSSRGTQRSASSPGPTAAAEWRLQRGNQYAMLHAGDGTGFGNTMRLDLHCADGAVSALYLFSPSVNFVTSAVDVRIGNGQFERQEWNQLESNALDVPVTLMTQLLFADVLRVRTATTDGPVLSVFDLRRTGYYLGRMQCTA